MMIKGCDSFDCLELFCVSSLSIFGKFGVWTVLSVQFAFFSVVWRIQNSTIGRNFFLTFPITTLFSLDIHIYIFTRIFYIIKTSKIDLKSDNRNNLINLFFFFYIYVICSLSILALCNFRCNMLYFITFIMSDILPTEDIRFS